MAIASLHPDGTEGNTKHIALGWSAEFGYTIFYFHRKAIAFRWSAGGWVYYFSILSCYLHSPLFIFLTYSCEERDILSQSPKHLQIKCLYHTKHKKAPPPDMTIIATYIRCDNLLMESLYRKGGQSDTVKV